MDLKGYEQKNKELLRENERLTRAVDDLKDEVEKARENAVQLSSMNDKSANEAEKFKAECCQLSRQLEETICARDMAIETITKQSKTIQALELQLSALQSTPDEMHEERVRVATKLCAIVGDLVKGDF